MVGGTEFGKSSAGKVVGGDWNQTVERLREYDLYQMMKRHFVDGVPWEETERYQDLVAQVQSGGSVWHYCTTETDIAERCRGLDELYRQIDEEGFLHPRELESDAYDDPLFDHSANRFPVPLQAISINIGPDGEPILDDGRHRVIVASLCGVSEIPVTILVRHARWQAKRDKSANGEIELDHFDSPDRSQYAGTPSKNSVEKS